MAVNRISLNGRLTTWQEAELDPSKLLGANWVYTTINTFGYKPLALKDKLRYAAESCKVLFGTRPQCGVEEIAVEIRNLLYFGLYPEGGNTVNLYFIPSASGTLDRLILHEATTPYEGLALQTIRPRATIANYEIPFEKHLTAVSRTAARYTDNYAASRGYTIALRANRAGHLLSSGDNPLFAMRGRALLTTPLGAGARPSTERDMMFRVAELAGLRVIEEPLHIDDVEHYDEMMLFTPVGIQSIDSVGEIKYVNIYATVLSKFLGGLEL